jgi:hypothetical protein
MVVTPSLITIISCVGYLIFYGRVHPEHDFAGGWFDLVAISFLATIYYLVGEVYWDAAIGKRANALRIGSPAGVATYGQRLVRWSVKMAPLFALLLVSLIAFVELRSRQARFVYYQRLPNDAVFNEVMETVAITATLALLIVDLGWALLDVDHRPMHDRVAGTVVTARPEFDGVRGFEPVLRTDQLVPNATSTLPTSDRDV